MGLLGNVMIAIAVHQVVGMDVGDPDLSGAWLLPLGIVVSMIALFLGGGGLVFLTLFLAVGVGALSTGESFGVLFGGIFAATALGLGAMGLALRVKSEQAQKLVATGVSATGTVVSVTDTGMTINENPRVQLVMRIEPEDGSSPFEATKAVTVSRVAVPRVGDEFPVWYDRENPTRWAYGVPTPARL